MSQKIIYNCDCCGENFDKEIQLWLTCDRKSDVANSRSLIDIV